MWQHLQVPSLSAAAAGLAYGSSVTVQGAKNIGSTANDLYSMIKGGGGSSKPNYSYKSGKQLISSNNLKANKGGGKMVNTIRFDISKSQAILLYLPCEKKDIVPTTDVFLKYWRGGNVEYDLFVNDFINEAVKQLYNLLTRAMNNELQLNKEFVDKGVGYYHNIYLHELFTTDHTDIYNPAEKIIVWSTPTEVGIETYIYNIDGEIYLEISPFYKWDSDYPDDENEYQTFEEYKPASDD